MDRPDVDPIQVRAFLRAKRERRQAALADRLERARSDADRIRLRIAHELDPTRIYQWGSLLTGEHFSEISDIDFAIEGLSGPADYSRALDIAIEETSFPIDIVQIDKLSPQTRERIIRRGRIVYERAE